MDRKRKRSVSEVRPPPGNIATTDNQGGSELCVRFAIGKAVAHHLYIHEKIDIDQSHIMICLVQAIGAQDPKLILEPVNPKRYNGTTIFVQDRENQRPKPSKCQKCKEGSEAGVPDKSWWKVRAEILKIILWF